MGAAMKILAAITLTVLLAALNAFAPAQAPDRIIYQSKEYSLQTNPMEEYFAKHPDKQPRSGVMSTALWRGYVATFEF
jgi:hypothetical protein